MQQNRSMLLSTLLCGSAVMAPLHAQPLSTDSTIRDVLAQPAFQDFAERLLPWDAGREPPDLPLNRVAELMPYHSHIHPAEIVETLNHMAAQRARGKTVFYEIYAEADKRRDPGKRHTGIFMFKGRDKAPFTMIAPGGGFAYVGSLHEGFPIAKRVAAQGYNAFVVKYR
ncbi:MAG: alpha/beta hydrolase, partial [Cardiobacterium hominis]